MIVAIRAKARNGPLLKWREDSRQTQAEAAKAAGVPMTTWNAIECFRFQENIGLDTVSKIAEYICSTVDEIWPASLRGKRIETERTAYRAANPERLLSECSQKELLALPSPVSLDEPIDQEEVKQVIALALRGLTFRERSVIEMRYGIRTRPAATLDECAKMFRVTRERIRQIEIKALRKMKDAAGEATVNA